MTENNISLDEIARRKKYLLDNIILIMLPYIHIDQKSGVVTPDYQKIKKVNLDDKKKIMSFLLDTKEMTETSYYQYLEAKKKDKEFMNSISKKLFYAQRDSLSCSFHQDLWKYLLKEIQKEMKKKNPIALEILEKYE